MVDDATAQPEPLWAISLEEGAGSVTVYPHEVGAFRVRVTLPHPDYLGPDVVGEGVVSRDRLRRLWLETQDSW